jgi:hypothetical protein
MRDSATVLLILAASLMAFIATKAVPPTIIKIKDPKLNRGFLYDLSFFTRLIL